MLQKMALNFSDPPASTSRVLGLQVSAPGLVYVLRLESKASCMLDTPSYLCLKSCGHSRITQGMVKTVRVMEEFMMSSGEVLTCVTLDKSLLLSSLSFSIYKPRCLKRSEDGISLNLEWV